MTAGGWALKMARWMSRRNGEAVAKALAAGLKASRKREPDLPEPARWDRMLEGRPGWRRVREGLHQFKTGERVEFKVNGPAEEWLRRITCIEVRPLSEGMPEELQGELTEKSIEAALEWWRRNGEG